MTQGASSRISGSRIPGDSAAAGLLIEWQGKLGLLTLNRPQALNTLDLDAVRSLTRGLKTLATDPQIEAVLIRGTGGKAFCAGGDMRDLIAALAPGEPLSPGLKREFFTLGYRLSQMIQTYPKPFVALIDGITMGGGAGISISGRYRVASERTLFAAPEAALGFFPDVGATWFLNRCPGEMGLFLALTGRRIRAADALALGLATHYLAAAHHERLVQDLARLPHLDHGIVAALLESRHEDPGTGEIAPQRAAIDRVFSAPDLETLSRTLARETAPWAEAARAALERASPTSLAVAWRQIRGGRGLTLAQALEIEYRLAWRLVDGHDFREGVRSILVEKDNTPRWRPGRLAAIDPAAIDRLFEPFPNSEEEWSAK